MIHSFLTKLMVSSKKTAHLSYISHEIQIVLRTQMGVSIPHLKNETAKFVHSKLSLSL